MEKSRANLPAVTDSIRKLDLSTNPNSSPSPNPNPNSIAISTGNVNTSRFSGVRFRRTKPPSLVSLCLEIIGSHLEEIVSDLADIAVSFPADIKMAVAAMARRRRLLDDDVIISLADSTWEILDVCGSDVSDVGLAKLAGICTSLRAVDISRCENITAAGVYELVRHCPSLETLRCGGSPRSDYTARSCLGFLKPTLKNVEGDSWEELDTTEIVGGSESLRWLVWPRIDKSSLESFTMECPRIVVNPKPSPFRGLQVPREALPNIILDDPFVEDIDPNTWVKSGVKPKIIALSSLGPPEMSMAEKFRLAFLERDNRLAPKRAKNARQHQRRAEREWLAASSGAKAIVLASQVSRLLHKKN